MYYRRANAAMIVYDITREKSFEDAQEWVKGVSPHTHTHTHTYTIANSSLVSAYVTTEDWQCNYLISPLSLSLSYSAELEGKVDGKLGMF